MAVKLNINRNHWEDVDLVDDDGNKGQIKVKFRVPKPEDGTGIQVLDLITDIEGFDLHDNGRKLSLDETLEVLKVDDSVAMPIIKAYNEGKKRRLGLDKTSLK